MNGYRGSEIAPAWTSPTRTERPLTPRLRFPVQPHPEKANSYTKALISLPPPPEPPFDIDTFEPIHPPWQAIRGWIPNDEDEEPEAHLEFWDQSPTQSWTAPEIDLGDGRTLVLEYTESMVSCDEIRKSAAKNKILGNAARKS